MTHAARAVHVSRASAAAAGRSPASRRSVGGLTTARGGTRPDYRELVGSRASVPVAACAGERVSDGPGALLCRPYLARVVGTYCALSRSRREPGSNEGSYLIEHVIRWRSRRIDVESW